VTKKEAPERASFFARAGRGAQGPARPCRQEGQEERRDPLARAHRHGRQARHAVLLGREEALRRLRTSLEKLQK